MSTRYDDLHNCLTLRYLLARGESLATDYDLEAFNGWLEKHVPSSEVAINDRNDASLFPLVGVQHAEATGYSFCLYDAGDTVIIIEDMPFGKAYMPRFDRVYNVPWPTPSFKRD